MKTKYNITEINPKTIKQVRQMIKDSLSVIMEDNNLRFELGNATYDDDSFKFTGFRISLADALTPEQKTLKQIIDMRRNTYWLKTIDNNNNDECEVGYNGISNPIDSPAMTLYVYTLFKQECNDK